jgi:hypothetical protein
MSNRRFFSSALVAMSWVAFAGRSAAQPVAKPSLPSRDALQEAARESELGSRLVTMGVYETAMTHFQKAFALGHKPADLQKIAECYRALGQSGSAYDAYAELLATYRPALGYLGALAAKKALAELEAATGLLDVRSTPDGAVVRVGERILGTTPLPTPVRLGAGPVRVEVFKDGYDLRVTEVTVDPTHPARVEASLDRRVMTGHLAVREAHSAHADLAVDDQVVGSLPWEGDVPPGVHRLAIQATNLRAEPQTIKVPRAGRAEATFTADFTAGQLEITTEPKSAQIALDGKPIGTGTFAGQVAVGDHVLRIAAAGYTPIERPIAIAGQTTFAAQIALEPQVTDADIAAAEAARDREAMLGFYGQVTFFGVSPAVATHIECSDAAAAVGAVSSLCNPGFAYGGGAALRGGYSFGSVGLELVGALMVDHWEDDIPYTATSIQTSNPAKPSIGAYQHSEAYTFTEMSGILAAGPRLATTGRLVRVTIGAAGGVAFRNVQLDRTMSSGLSESSPYSGSALVASPGLLGDAGFIFGSPPGASFVLGAMAWVEFPASAELGAQAIQETTSGGTRFTTTSGPYTLLSGPQLYVGPYLGVRFGH